MASSNFSKWPQPVTESEISVLIRVRVVLALRIPVSPLRVEYRQPLRTVYRLLFLFVAEDRELAEVLEAMMASTNRPAAEVVDELKQVIKEQGTIPAVGKAIRLLRSGGSGRLETLEDFTFAQYRTLICCDANWPQFEPVFDTMRELLNADFAEVNERRNIVFHFRRGITPNDTDRLRRFRDRLRYDRELFAKEQQQMTSKST